MLKSFRKHGFTVPSSQQLTQSSESDVKKVTKHHHTVKAISQDTGCKEGHPSSITVNTTLPHESASTDKAKKEKKKKTKVDRTLSVVSSGPVKSFNVVAESREHISAEKKKKQRSYSEKTEKRKTTESAKPIKFLTDEEYDEIFSAVTARIMSNDNASEFDKNLAELAEEHALADYPEEQAHLDGPGSDINIADLPLDEIAELLQEENEGTPLGSDDENTQHDTPIQKPSKPVKNASKSQILEPRKLHFHHKKQVRVIEMDHQQADKSGRGKKTVTVRDDKKRGPLKLTSNQNNMFVAHKSLPPEAGFLGMKRQRLSSKDVLHDRTMLNTGTWVQCCERSCQKWRHLKKIADPSEIPEFWICSLNTEEAYNSCDKPQVKFNEAEHQQTFVFTKFTEGSVVWAKMAGFPWWPAMVEIDPDTTVSVWVSDNNRMIATHYHVVFFDDHVSRAWVKQCNIRPLTDNSNGPPGTVVKKGRSYKKEIILAKNNALGALKLSLQERLKKYSFAARFSGKWGKQFASTVDESDDDDVEIYNPVQIQQRHCHRPPSSIPAPVSKRPEIYPNSDEESDEDDDDKENQAPFDDSDQDKDYDVDANDDDDDDEELSEEMVSAMMGNAEIILNNAEEVVDNLDENIVTNDDGDYVTSVLAGPPEDNYERISDFVEPPKKHKKSKKRKHDNDGKTVSDSVSIPKRKKHKREHGYDDSKSKKEKKDKKRLKEKKDVYAVCDSESVSINTEQEVPKADTTRPPLDDGNDNKNLLNEESQSLLPLHFATDKTPQKKTKKGFEFDSEIFTAEFDNSDKDRGGSKQVLELPVIDKIIEKIDNEDCDDVVMTNDNCAETVASSVVSGTDSSDGTKVESDVKTMAERPVKDQGHEDEGVKQEPQSQKSFKKKNKNKKKKIDKNNDVKNKESESDVKNNKSSDITITSDRNTNSSHSQSKTDHVTNETELKRTPKPKSTKDKFKAPSVKISDVTEKSNNILNKAVKQFENNAISNLATIEADTAISNNKNSATPPPSPTLSPELKKSSKLRSPAIVDDNVSDDELDLDMVEPTSTGDMKALGVTVPMVTHADEDSDPFDMDDD